MIQLKKLSSYALLILGLDWHVVPVNSVLIEGENVTVLRDEGKFRSGYLNTKTFHGGKCRVGLSHRFGNLYVERGVDVYGYLQHETFFSSSSSNLGPGNYYAKINQDDGSLVIYKSQSSGDKVSWRTASYADSSFHENTSDITKPFRLKIDEACVLRLVGKIENDEGTLEDREVWSHIRDRMTKLDIMQKGEIMSGFIPSLCSDGSSGHVYCVQSITSHLLLLGCNIVQKIGLFVTYFEESINVWDSNSVKIGDPDCYIFNNGDFIGVFEGKWDDYDRKTLYPERQGLIWRTPEKDEQGNVQDNWDETQLYGDRGFYPN